MKKNTKFFVSLMTLIGMICTAVLVCYFMKDHIKNTSLYKKFFGGDDDFDMEFFDDEFDEEETEETDSEKTISEEEDEVIEEEVATPKTRRGYIPLRFPSEQSA